MSRVNPETRRRICALPTCPVLFETPHGGSWPAKYCSPTCHRASKPKKAPQPRSTLLTTTPRAQRPISPASTAQRLKRDLGACIVTGATTNVDPAHLCPRGKGGCDDPLCVVPLARDVHRAFDDGQVDLMPYLCSSDYTAELQHALGHYRGNLLALLQRLTGTRWVPAMHPHN